MTERAEELRRERQQEQTLRRAAGRYGRSSGRPVYELSVVAGSG